MEKISVEIMLEMPEVKCIIAKLEELIKDNRLRTSIIASKLHCLIPELHHIDTRNLLLVFGKGENTFSYKIENGECIPV